MKKVIIPKEQYSEIINLYKNGFSGIQIAEKYGVVKSTIYEILARCNITDLTINRRIFKTDEEERIVCNMYLSGISSMEIAKKFNCAQSVVTKLLKRNGVDTRKRYYYLNEHYFDEIDTPNKAYILGFFYADGNNSVDKNTICMALQEGDKDILEAIRKEIGSDKPLDFIDRSKKRAEGCNCKDQYKLAIYSEYMCKILQKKGMVPRKSLVLQWPTFLRDDLYSHFLRGFLEGDGTIDSRRTAYRASFLGPYSFCRDALEYIENKLGIQGYIQEDVCKNGITANLVINHKEQVKKFLDYIYQDAELYLERKYNIYISKYCSEESINDTLTV